MCLFFQAFNIHIHTHARTHHHNHSHAHTTTIIPETAATVFRKIILLLTHTHTHTHTHTRTHARTHTIRKSVCIQSGSVVGKVCRFFPHCLGGDPWPSHCRCSATFALIFRPPRPPIAYPDTCARSYACTASCRVIGLAGARRSRDDRVRTSSRSVFASRI